MRKASIITLLLTICLSSVLPIQAQPGGRGGMRGMRGMGGGGVEQILSYLAFDEKISVNDEQLIKLRNVLKETHTYQQQMQKTIRAEMEANDGNFDGVREKMMEMRAEMEKVNASMQKNIAAVLDKDQHELFQTHMKAMEERRGRGRGDRGGRGGRGGRGNREGRGGRGQSTDNDATDKNNAD